MMKDEKDDFWDVASLLPRTKKRQGRVRFDTSGVDISEPVTDTSSPDRETLRLTGEGFGAAQRKSESHLYGHTPDSAFIRRVSVYSQQSSYRYYEDFDDTMHKYMRLTVKEAERVPFFSYVPQYSQLSAPRLSWYLFWRSGCRARNYMQTDYSYVLLYVFELLNFANPRYPDRMIEELCSLWRAYRDDYPQLDRCMPDWVCDYCLVHRVSLPYDIVGDFLDSFLQYASLREFYLGRAEQGECGYARALILGASGYNYKKSKFYTPEHKSLYDEHILSAAAYAVGTSSEKFRDVCRGEKMSVMRRDAYAGALCTYKAKRVIVAEYLPLYRSGDLRMDATFAVKYAENRLRSYIGVRSRLGVDGISERIRTAVDEYFDSHLGSSAYTHREYGQSVRDTAEYMAYYDSPTAVHDFERSLDIEQDSWETARLMGESFEDEGSECRDKPERDPECEMERETECEIERETECEIQGEIECDATDDSIRLDVVMREVLILIAQGKCAEAQQTAIASGSFISEVVERINEAALDFMGDIIIERDSDEYHIIEDYESEVKIWLKI